MRRFRSICALLVVTLALMPAIFAPCAMAACPRICLKTPQPAAEDDRLDVFFYPLGLTTGIGLFIPSLSPDPPGYPQGGSSSGGGNTGGGGSTGGTPTGTPEPATVISAVLGASLLGLFGWRRRRAIC
jgi:hypothetical protein